MTFRVADELARVFRPWNVELLLFSGFGVVFVVGVIVLLWYSYSSRYVYEQV